MKHCCITLLFFSFLYQGVSQAISMDENFDEWNALSPVYSDAAGDDGPSGIDFDRIWTHNDQNYLYLNIEVGKEINLQDNNEIRIAIDIDNNSNTGSQQDGIGVDIMYEFGSRYGFYYSNGSNDFIEHPDLGLVTAPTVSSSRFDLSFLRQMEVQGKEISMGNTIRFRIYDNENNGDELPEPNESISYSFNSDNIQTIENLSLEKLPDTDFRLLSYNVLFDSFFDFPNSEAQKRIIKAIDPDIIAFQEIYDHSANEVADEIENLIPLSSGQWYRAKISPDIIVISKLPIVFFDAIQGNGAFVLEHEDKEILLINAHLPCCSNNEDRQDEIDHILSFIRDMKQGNGPYPLLEDSPIIITGDLNLVGDAQQQTSLLNGDIINEGSYGSDLSPDWDGADFVDAKPPATHPSFFISWYDEFSSFAPGRLDYQIYTTSVLEKRNSFCLATMFLDPNMLENYELFKNDSKTGSDHLPVVVDYAFKTQMQQVDVNDHFWKFKLAPNPANEEIRVQLDFVPDKDFMIKILDAKGYTIKLVNNIKMKEFTIDVNDLPNGSYILQLKTGNLLSSRSFVIQRS